MYKKIVVKIGTNVITSESGLLDEHIMEQIASQIAELKRKGMDIVIVSSGAVGAGRSLVPNTDKMNQILKRQILASVGQIDLMNTYSMIFEKYNYLCAQVLATKEDFRDRRHYLNMKNCFEGLLQDKIIPIVNENDVISVSELMFTDNDELAGLIASMLNVDALIMLTSVEGVFDQDPESKNANLVKVIDPKEKNFQKYISPKKSLFGRGGMATKCRIASELSLLGIGTHIANGKLKNVLIDIVQGKEIGTQFKPHKKVSSVKKWIAHAKGSEKGIVYINEGAQTALLEKVSSLLPVGIVKIEGNFEKGDIIQIRNEQKKIVGLGIAQYDSKKAKDYIGQKGKRPLIHYDYLFLQV